MNQKSKKESSLFNFNLNRIRIPKNKTNAFNIRIATLGVERDFTLSVVPSKNMIIRSFCYLVNLYTVAVKSRQILRENNRKKEETAVCISIETGEVLLEQHSEGLVVEVNTSKLNGQPADSVIITHNHPTGMSFSERDLEFMGNNPQIHTMLAVTPDGKVFSLRTNCGKSVDRYIVSEYNKNINAGLTREETLRDMAKKYGWEYKEL